MFERPRLKFKIVAMMPHGSLEGSSWPISTAIVLRRAYLPQLTTILLWTIISVVLLNCQGVLKLPSTTKRKSYYQIPNSPSSAGVKNQNCGPESQFHSVMAFILSCPNEVSESSGGRELPYTCDVTSTGPRRQNTSVITQDANERQHPISQREHCASYIQGTGLSTASANQGTGLKSDSHGLKGDSLGRKSDSLSLKNDSLGRKSGSLGRKSGSESLKSVPDSQMSLGAAQSRLTVPRTQLRSLVFYNQKDIPSSDEDAVMKLDEQLLRDIERSHLKELLKQQENVASKRTAFTGESLPLSIVTMITDFFNNKGNLSKQAINEDRKDEDGIESTSKSQDYERDIFES